MSVPKKQPGTFAMLAGDRRLEADAFDKIELAIDQIVGAVDILTEEGKAGGLLNQITYEIEERLGAFAQ